MTNQFNKQIQSLPSGEVITKWDAFYNGDAYEVVALTDTIGNTAAEVKRHTVTGWEKIYDDEVKAELFQALAQVA